MNLTLPKWYDLHTHLRQGGFLQPLIEQHLKMGCAGVLAMPNTKPPVAKVFKNDPAAGWSIEDYIEMLNAAGGDAFQRIIVPLYLTATTTAKMIDEGAKKGILKACKYYPPHGTTNAEHGASLSRFMENGVLAAMEDNGIVFCVHGEDHGMVPEEYYDSAINAETAFYQKRMGAVIKEFPSLRIVAEHITTKAAVDFVLENGPKIGATITPQHLLYTVGHMMQGLKYHLYCMPIVKFDRDREALRRAVISPDNTKFFAGTDSAPHTVKATSCGCAAGCYTGGIAPQLYAEAFEQAGATMKSDEAQLAFKNFLCLNGAVFYGLPIPKETFTLSKKPQSIGMLETPEGPVTPLTIGMLPTSATETTLNWSVEL